MDKTEYIDNNYISYLLVLISWNPIYMLCNQLEMTVWSFISKTVRAPERVKKKSLHKWSRRWAERGVRWSHKKRRERNENSLYLTEVSKVHPRQISATRNSESAKCWAWDKKWNELLNVCVFYTCETLCTGWMNPTASVCLKNRDCILSETENRGDFY